ncbi:MAG: hypothetical protein ACP5T3_00700 [Candidatus Micrarchaeia archaeon]
MEAIAIRKQQQSTELKEAINGIVELSLSYASNTPFNIIRSYFSKQESYMPRDFTDALEELLVELLHAQGVDPSAEVTLNKLPKRRDLTNVKNGDDKNIDTLRAVHREAFSAENYVNQYKSSVAQVTKVLFEHIPFSFRLGKSERNKVFYEGKSILNLLEVPGAPVYEGIKQVLVKDRSRYRPTEFKYVGIAPESAAESLKNTIEQSGNGTIISGDFLDESTIKEIKNNAKTFGTAGKFDMIIASNGYLDFFSRQEVLQAVRSAYDLLNENGLFLAIVPVKKSQAYNYSYLKDALNDTGFVNASGLRIDDNDVLIESMRIGNKQFEYYIIFAYKSQSPFLEKRN